MPWKEGVTSEQVQAFQKIEAYVHELDKQIYDGALTPKEAGEKIQDKIDELWNALHPPEADATTAKATKKEAKSAR